jgi:hypothetical protein
VQPASHGRSSCLPTPYRLPLCPFAEKGQTRAAFAGGHSILLIDWHLVAHDRYYPALDDDHFNRATDRSPASCLARQLEALGHKVTTNRHRIALTTSDHRPPRYPAGSPIVPRERVWSPEFRFGDHDRVLESDGVSRARWMSLNKGPLSIT